MYQRVKACLGRTLFVGTEAPREKPRSWPRSHPERLTVQRDRVAASKLSEIRQLCYFARRNRVRRRSWLTDNAIVPHHGHFDSICLRSSRAVHRKLGARSTQNAKLSVELSAAISRKFAKYDIRYSTTRYSNVRKPLYATDCTRVHVRDHIFVPQAVIGRSWLRHEFSSERVHRRHELRWNGPYRNLRSSATGSCACTCVSTYRQRLHGYRCMVLHPLTKVERVAGSSFSDANVCTLVTPALAGQRLPPAVASRTLGGCYRNSCGPNVHASWRVIQVQRH